VLGLVLLLGVLPFLLVSLASPALAGLAGQRVARALFAGLGQTAWLLPFLVAAQALQMLGRVLSLRLGLASLLLFLDLALLGARMGGQGGALGGWLDGHLVPLVGPAGSWITALGGLVLGLCLVCRLEAHQVLEGVMFLLRHLERLALLLLRPLAAAPRALGDRLRSAGPRLETAAPRAGSRPAAAAEAPPPWAGGEAGAGREGLALPEGEPGSPEDTLEEDLPPEIEPPESLQETPAPASPPAAAVPAPPEPAPAAPVPEDSAPGPYEEPGGQLHLFPVARPCAVPQVRYRLPPLSLLDDPPPGGARQVEDKSHLLVDTLESFGVQARVVNVVRGPTVTRYELQPARGVKVSRFTSLTSDIALALAATSVRIEAPIPGKSAIGIEIPNRSTDLVVLKEVLASEAFRKGQGLCLGLGKDISGQVVVADLQKMPHLLVAGTTGSGKSVCVNTLILSLIYRFTPRRLQLLMVDPKQVELSIYEGLPHLVGLAGEPVGQILVEPKRAALALNQMVELMEERYRLFARARVRNLKEYNAQTDEELPWVVVLIDELADLMMVAPKSVETSICRLAQKARAAGIHVVLATQRPSTDVITGLIKVNVPSRIAFAVSSQVDSRVILDTGGAEHLLGKGDMLFLPVDASDPRRVQGAYVGNQEIQNVVEFWKAQAAPENRIELEVAEVSEEAAEEAQSEDEDDELCQQALQVILRTQQASASMLQTELKVGYARARRILTLLERKGHVGPAEGSKPRKILYTGG
jgi:S-DNA-T family DNA segregation ATPase FtsK/SpoIIIE